ncbi:MAG: gliding motility-associated C-terminal domain-containing protein [Sphingobacteriaceae bacterium]|nr:gliding motility-associated C-terminal domain-containing protein [Sphingobacteriaceae bacterium]
MKQLLIKLSKTLEMNKLIFIGLITLFSIGVTAQSISPSVINSGGRTSTTTVNSQTVIYTDNIGEAVIGSGSASGNIITQGFLQPDYSNINGVSVTVFSANVSCSDKRDGFIRVEVENHPDIAFIKYFWTPDTLCPTHDCDRVDSLSAGTFTVEAKWMFNNGRRDSSDDEVIITDKNGICDLKVYTGITLSGSNSKLTIDNIEIYPHAVVSVYNRWGVKLFSADKYNYTDNYWPKKNEKVIAGTYFYIIDAGKDGVIKSWIEVFE